LTATAADATLTKGRVGDPFSSAWRRRLPLLPALLYVVVITQLPFLVSIYYSLTDLKDKTQSLIPEPTRFVGSRTIGGSSAIPSSGRPCGPA
jgi:sorbitol/mannitol transport system permease protein